MGSPRKSVGECFAQSVIDKGGSKQDRGRARDIRRC